MRSGSRTSVERHVSFVPASLDGLAILLWAADPDHPHRLATPFVHACAAAAFDIPVEMHFTAHSVRLLVPGVADRLRASEHHPKTIGDALREAVALGARLYACTAALEAQGIDPSGLIAECAGLAGATAFMERAVSSRWRVLVY